MTKCEKCGNKVLAGSQLCTRCTIFSTIMKQARALGLSWRDVCTPLMIAQKITVADVEAELQREIDRCTLEISADNAKAEYFRMRAVLYCQLGEHDRAWDDATHAITLNARETWGYLVRGVVHWHRGQYEDAICEYDKALAIQPDLKWAHNLRNGAYEKLGRPPQSSDK